MDTPESNKEIVRAFYRDVFQRLDLECVDTYMHDYYIQHNPDVEQGKKGFLGFFTLMFRAMPDFCASIKEIVAERDLVFVYNAVSATHSGGDFLGRKPTGNRLEYDVVDIFRLEGGKLAEHWDVADTRKLFTQLGAIREV